MHQSGNDSRFDAGIGKMPEDPASPNDDITDTYGNHRDLWFRTW